MVTGHPRQLFSWLVAVGHLTQIFSWLGAVDTGTIPMEKKDFFVFGVAVSVAIALRSTSIRADLGRCFDVRYLAASLFSSTEKFWCESASIIRGNPEALWRRKKKHNRQMSPESIAIEERSLSISVSVGGAPSFWRRRISVSSIESFKSPLI